MSVPDSASASPATEARHREPTPRTAPSGWVVGMALFAAVVMIVAGIFEALQGLAALFRNEVYVVGPRYIYSFDVTTWGWIHLLLGILVAVAGFAVISGRLWGRSVGIILAVLSMIANFLFVPYYPVWSVLIIALDAFVIWALCLYSRDAARA